MLFLSGVRDILKKRMKLSTKFIILSMITLILKIISVCTPEWTVFLIDTGVHVNNKNRMNDTALKTTKAYPNEFDTTKTTSENHKKIGSDGEHGVCIYQGLWYSVECTIGSFEGRDDWRSCKYGTYQDDRDIFTQYDFIGDQHKIFQMAEELSIVAFKFETLIGLVALVIAIVTLLASSRSFKQRKKLGHISCVFFLLSGLLFWVAVGETFLLISDSATRMTEIPGNITFEMGVPWSSIIGAIGGTMSLGIALGLLVTIAGKYEERVNAQEQVYSVLNSYLETEMKVFPPPSYTVEP